MMRIFKRHFLIWEKMRQYEKALPGSINKIGMFSFLQPGLHLFTLLLEAGWCWELPGPSAPLCGGSRPGRAQQAMLNPSPCWALPPILCWEGHTAVAVLWASSCHSFPFSLKAHDPLQQPSLVPGLSREDHRAFMKHCVSMNYCYQEHAKKNPRYSTAQQSSKEGVLVLLFLTSVNQISLEKSQLCLRSTHLFPISS